MTAHICRQYHLLFAATFRCDLGDFLQGGYADEIMQLIDNDKLTATLQAHSDCNNPGGESDTVALALPDKTVGLCLYARKPICEAIEAPAHLNRQRVLLQQGKANISQLAFACGSVVIPVLLGFRFSVSLCLNSCRGFSRGLAIGSIASAGLAIIS